MGIMGGCSAHWRSMYYSLLVVLQVPFKVAVGLNRLTSLVVKSAEKPWLHSWTMEIRLRSTKTGKYLTDGCQKVAGEKVKGRCGTHGSMIRLVGQQEYPFSWRTCWYIG